MYVWYKICDATNETDLNRKMGKSIKDRARKK